jgi:hypothetical protein
MEGQNKKNRGIKTATNPDGCSVVWYVRHRSRLLRILEFKDSSLNYVRNASVVCLYDELKLYVSRERCWQWLRQTKGRATEKKAECEPSKTRFSITGNYISTDLLYSFAFKKEQCKFESQKNVSLILASVLIDTLCQVVTMVSSHWRDHSPNVLDNDSVALGSRLQDNCLHR